MTSIFYRLAGSAVILAGVTAGYGQLRMDPPAVLPPPPADPQEICVSVYNDGPADEKTHISLYDVAIPPGGAMPSNKANVTPVAPTQEIVVPAQRDVPVRGGGSYKKGGNIRVCFKVKPIPGRTYWAVTGNKLDKDGDVPLSSGTYSSLTVPLASPANRPSNSLLHSAIRGKTLLRDIYQLTGDHRLIGFLDPNTHTIYAAEGATERVKAAFSVTETRGRTWIVGHKVISGEYQFSPIERLNLDRQLTAGMAAVNEKSVCKRTRKGACTNVYDEDGKFAYSWIAPEEMFQCYWSDKQDCTDIWTTVNIDEYKQKNCQGPTTAVKEEVSTCLPN